MAKKYKIKGHETFILREGWINKGLREVGEDPYVFTKNYGADVLGVGPNMAKSIRYWMRCSKLSEEGGKKGVNLTPLGEKILEKDAYLEDVFSLWLIHCNIVKNAEQATAWNLFFNQYDEVEFTKEDMVKEMTRLAEEMNVKRIYVSKALNELQSEGLIQLERGRIYIPALENLIKR